MFGTSTSGRFEQAPNAPWDLLDQVGMPAPVRAAALGPGVVLEDRPHVEGVLPGLGRGEGFASRILAHPRPHRLRLRLRRVTAEVRYVDVIARLVPPLEAVLVAGQRPTVLGLFGRPFVSDGGVHGCPPTAGGLV